MLERERHIPKFKFTRNERAQALDKNLWKASWPMNIEDNYDRFDGNIDLIGAAVTVSRFNWVPVLCDNHIYILQATKSRHEKNKT